MYKLKEGACPKSYGLQVAVLAGVPLTVVRRAEEAANVMQPRLAAAASFEEQRELTEEERFVDAIVSAVDGDNGSDAARENSYSKLLSLWRELRRNKQILGDKSAGVSI